MYATPQSLDFETPKIAALTKAIYKQIRLLPITTSKPMHFPNLHEKSRVIIPIGIAPANPIITLINIV
jgi:hypothetical protein